uniref:MADF domain-containing protein n=1 Tax=Glossina austeni TaxID=7395 RepID=A0A1A9UTL2_GLOAU
IYNIYICIGIGKHVHIPLNNYLNEILLVFQQFINSSQFVNLAHFNDYTPRRGRPRSLPAMGEFDLSLINEFRSRPAFYDRNCPKFKDKIYTAHQWQEISNKLGFDVSILKDRMLQLRNRYNLEKRRLEQESNDRETTVAFEPSTILSEAQQIHSTTRIQQEQNSINTGYQPTITIRRLDTLRSPDPAVIEKPNKKRSYQCTQPAFSAGEPSQTTHQKEPCLSSRELRYAAFGNFVSSSLQDLPQNAALELVEKFTSEIVKSLLEKSEDFNGFPSD